MTTDDDGQYWREKATELQDEVDYWREAHHELERYLAALSGGDAPVGHPVSAAKVRYLWTPTVDASAACYECGTSADTCGARAADERVFGYCCQACWWYRPRFAHRAAEASLVTAPREKVSAYQIGGDLWPGLGKVIEESGELAQVAGKLIANSGERSHWDGTDLHDRLIEELGDVLAAIDFLIEANGLHAAAVRQRADNKLTLFRRWHRGAPDGMSR